MSVRVAVAIGKQFVSLISRLMVIESLIVRKCFGKIENMNHCSHIFMDQADQLEISGNRENYKGCVSNRADLRSSLDGNGSGSGGDAVSDDNKLARAQLLGCRHIEMSRHQSAGCNGHAAVIVRSAIKHVSSCIVGDAHERIVRCRLLIVPVSSPLRHAIETMAGDDV
jgi:hypothetical protein